LPEYSLRLFVYDKNDHREGRSEEEARYLASLLNSASPREFFSATIFWDPKRPMTIETHLRLDLSAFATELGSLETFVNIQRESRPCAKSL
jgi:hypothetical protein